MFVKDKCVDRRQNKQYVHGNEDCLSQLHAFEADTNDPVVFK